MRWIDKGAAPSCLAERRREMKRVERQTGRPTAPADWNPGACASHVRSALHRDQGGLCGYCTQRTFDRRASDYPEPTGNRGLRIEHIATRESEPTRMYDYDNLVGVCVGLSGTPGGQVFSHCDRHRGSQTLAIDPTRRAPDPETVFTFRRCPDTDGLLVVTTEGNEDYAPDITVLNLNNPALAQRRREAERAIASALRRTRRPAQRRRILEGYLRVMQTPDANGHLPEFAPVVERYVRRKLDQS